MNRISRIIQAQTFGSNRPALNANCGTANVDREIHNRLGIEDPTAVSHMRVHADELLSPLIDARLPHALIGIQSHHIGRRKLQATPARIIG